MKRVASAIPASILLGLGILAPAASPTAPPGHFILHSDIDPRLLLYVMRNVEAYYQNLTPRFFAKGFDRPLAIYYSRTAAQSRALLERCGESDDIGYGRYYGRIRTPAGTQAAVFTQRWMDDGSPAGWGSLFHEITHHFVTLNFQNAPAWFNEGLASFLGERTRPVAGRCSFGRPNPWREQALRNLIAGGLEVDVRHLLGLSDEAFYRSPEGYHLARALFYWLYSEGRFDAYLRAAAGGRYSLSTLSQVTGRGEAAINRDLLAFIQRSCYPAAYLYDSREASALERRLVLVRRALAIRPEYQPAQLALASAYYDAGDYDHCRAALRTALADSSSPEHFEALWRAGDCDYAQRRYRQSLDHYRRAIAAGDYDDRQPELYYWIGCCCYFVGDRAGMRQWFRRFLQSDGEPEKHREWIAYAQKNL